MNYEDYTISYYVTALRRLWAVRILEEAAMAFVSHPEKHL
jgi:hypothetical protein